MATIDSRGRVTHIANGQTEIRANYQQLIAGTIVAIGVTVTSVTVSCMPETGAHRCDAIAHFSNGTSQAVTTSSETEWTSSNPMVATVDSNGRVTHIDNGQVEITARYRSSVGGIVLTLSGVATVTSVSVSCTPELQSYQCMALAVLSNGTSENVTTMASWQSSNTTVATVDASGRVRNRTTGQTDIRATYRFVTGVARLDIVVGAGTSVVINEFAPRGPDGGSEEYVEIRNDSLSPVVIDGWRLMRWTRDAPEVIALYFTYPADTTLAPGCHYLVAARASIAGVVPDVRVSSDLNSESGLALVRQDGSVVDQVGLHPESAYKEGTPLPAFGVDDSRGYARVGNDTNNNAFDFALQMRTPMNRTSSCAVR